MNAAGVGWTLGIGTALRTLAPITFPADCHRKMMFTPILQGVPCGRTLDFADIIISSTTV